MSARAFTKKPTDEELIILELKGDRVIPYLEFNRQPKGDPLLKLGVAAIVELNSFSRNDLK